LTQALQLNPRADDIWIARGTVYVNLTLAAQGDPTPFLAAARDDFDQAMKINSSNPTTLQNRGRTLHLWGKYKRNRQEDGEEELRAALADYEEAVRINPRLEASLKGWMDECRNEIGR